MTNTTASHTLAPQCTCPRCGNQYLMRLARIGFFEEKILPVFGYYPWVCGACRTMKYFRVRGKRMHRPAQPA
ncbi:MAG TPA: hypothetical protein VL967_09940 [Terracidiphilus sp.]|nr:hypothetical protein [Terracidiphilus sp.]